MMFTFTGKIKFLPEQQSLMNITSWFIGMFSWPHDKFMINLGDNGKTSEMLFAKKIRWIHLMSLLLLVIS